MELDIKPAKKTVDGDSKYAPNLYLEPPLSGSINVDEAEDLFRQRLEAMAVLKDFRINSQVPLNSVLMSIKSSAYSANCVSLYPTGEQRKLDNISHFLARIYFAMHPELWDSYKYFEKRLLKYRLGELNCFSADKLAAFLQSFNFDFELMPRAEYDEIKKTYLFWNHKSGQAASTISESIFKVNFEHALMFVAKRSVAVKDGFALLSTEDIRSVICDAFEQHLDKALRWAAQTLSLNSKVQNLYSNLDLVYKEFEEEQQEKKRLTKMEESSQKSPFSINMFNIDRISRDHYPPCMRHLHESLRKENHLRHHGRLYLGTFMRSAGVTEQEAIEFWREEFTKKIPNDKFERDYKYNIRHLYGKEGHRKALSSFSCEKIINNNAPGPADNHGCPFKHFDETHLVSLLKNHNIADADIEYIKDAKQRKTYTEACCEYFKSTRGVKPEEMRNPAQFYHLSARLEHDKVNNVYVKDEIDQLAESMEE